MFEEALRRYGLKYNVVGGFSFYERAEIKDMISYLKLIQNPDDSIAFLRVVNTPARGIGKRRWRRSNGWRSRPVRVMWSAMEQAIDQKLLPPARLLPWRNFAGSSRMAERCWAGVCGEGRSRELAEATSASLGQSMWHWRPSAGSVERLEAPASPAGERILPSISD